MIERKSEIIKYINSVLQTGKNNGLAYMELISGDIHSAMGYKNLMPSVCNAMKSIMQVGDEITATTASGNSSTITVRYSTNRK